MVIEKLRANDELECYMDLDLINSEYVAFRRVLIALVEKI